jgi:GTP 3',8-cyclase
MVPSSAHALSVQDRLGRSLRDLRISVTDRCNFRCTYCMPKEIYGRDHVFLPRSEILNFEEIARLARLFAELGTRKIRLTGGEPLLRKNLPDLIAMLRGIPGIEDIALTTNASALAVHAQALRSAGLDRLTVSLDALDDAVFRQMNDVDFPVQRVLEGLDAALAVGFGPIKINMVVKRGVNEQEILPMVRRFRGRDFILRFIEFMDAGHTNGWRMDEVVSAAEIRQIISGEFALLPLSPNYVGEVAGRYGFADGQGEVGIISSVSEPFCSGCSRGRIAADGQLYTCLFATQGQDLRALLRSELTDAGLREAVAAMWQSRADRYSELRSEATRSLPKMEMSRLGG